MATTSPKTCLTACLLLLLTVASLVASAPFPDHLDSPERSHGLHVERHGKQDDAQIHDKQDDAQIHDKQDDAQSHDKQDDAQSHDKQDDAQSPTNQDEAQSSSNQDDAQSPSNQDDAQSPDKHDVKNDNLNKGDIHPANLGSNNTLSYKLEEHGILTVNTNQENVSIGNREKQIISHNLTQDALENIKDLGDVNSRSKGKPEEDDSKEDGSKEEGSKDDGSVEEGSKDDGSVEEGSKDDGSVEEGSDYSTSGPLLPQLVNSSEPGTHKRTFFDYVDVFDIDYTGYRPYAYRPYGSYGYSPYYGYDAFGFDYL